MSNFVFLSFAFIGDKKMDVLDEYIHDNERNQREKKRVVLDGVNLKHDEGLIKERSVQVLIEGEFVVATSVEVLQKIVVGRQVNAFELVVPHNLRNTLGAVFIEGVERELLDFPCTEVGIVVVCDDILNEMVFRLRYPAVGSLPYQHDKVLQEANLLDVQLLPVDGKGIHRDRVLLRVADILAIDIVAEPFIGVPCIDHNNVCILFPKLSDYTVHVETLAATAWAKAEKI